MYWRMENCFKIEVILNAYTSMSALNCLSNQLFLDLYWIWNTFILNVSYRMWFVTCVFFSMFWPECFSHVFILYLTSDWKGHLLLGPTYIYTHKNGGWHLETQCWSLKLRSADTSNSDFLSLKHIGANPSMLYNIGQ